MREKQPEIKFKLTLDKNFICINIKKQNKFSFIDILTHTHSKATHNYKK